jgi:hypothetical protein
MRRIRFSHGNSTLNTLARKVAIDLGMRKTVGRSGEVLNGNYEESGYMRNEYQTID